MRVDDVDTHVTLLYSRICIIGFVCTEVRSLLVDFDSETASLQKKSQEASCNAGSDHHDWLVVTHSVRKLVQKIVTPVSLIYKNSVNLSIICSEFSFSSRVSWGQKTLLCCVCLKGVRTQR
jgi:hypothetical protein